MFTPNTFPTGDDARIEAVAVVFDTQLHLVRAYPSQLYAHSLCLRVLAHIRQRFLGHVQQRELAFMVKTLAIFADSREMDRNAGPRLEPRDLHGKGVVQAPIRQIGRS
jgi:hypothetical protein